ncbi:MAG: hypothetical protein KC657_32970 [Myxococcales bacterium]|nr:hypothetical protein [Myxococcales bacterium]
MHAHTPLLAACFFSLVAIACSPTPSGGAASSSGGSSSGSSGADPSDGGASGSGGAAGALPASTFLFTERRSGDSQAIVAYDLATQARRVVTDLRGDGSTGWEVDGIAISPDRTRIAIASLYGPTKADTDTGLPTRRIWTFAPDGTDFKRLTPVFENTGAGRKQFQIAVGAPAFTRDGSEVLYEYGEYWYEGTTLKGGSALWRIPSTGGVPALFGPSAPCSVLNPAVEPKTGALLAIHSVCAGTKDGLYLYPPGGGEPQQLLADGPIRVSLETPSWVADGSGFVFVGLQTVTIQGQSRDVRGLFAYDMQTKTASPVVLPDQEDVTVESAAIAPDASAIVYCTRRGDVRDLHVIDLRATPATDALLTQDGKSCAPHF